MNLFLEYPTCSTCKDVKKTLQRSGISFTERNIKEEHPSYEELEGWIRKSGKPIQSFFNTSGMVYRELRLKEKLPSMRDEEKIRLLATNGMLVKRPLLITETEVLIGKKEIETWVRK